MKFLFFTKIILNRSKCFSLFFSFILLSALILILPGLKPAQAQTGNQMLRISPLIFNINLSPGATYNYKVTIENLTSAPLPVKAYFENFRTTDEEGGYIFENKTANPLINWSSVNPKDMILNPKEKKTVDLKIQIPGKVPFGGYYGILFFEPIVGNRTNQKTLVSAKVGALLLANVGTLTKPSAQILDFSIPTLSESDNLPLLLRVQNNGLNHFSAKPILKIKPILGSEEKIFLEEKFVFPGKVRRWETSIDLNQKWRGIYKAELAISTGQGEQVYETKYFISLPISKSLLILLIISLTAFIILRRQRVMKALSILLKNKG